MSTEVELLERCTAAGIGVTADCRVGERDANMLLGNNPDYLRKLRDAGQGPRFYRRAAFGCRVSYRLADLLAWIDAGEADRSEFSAQPGLTGSGRVDR